MGYSLGVDLGTTFTAAAVERDGRVEMATLGDRAAAVPSVVLLRADGSVLTGDAADRRAASEPDRVARECKRRLGDPMPVILGGAPQPVQELMAMQLRDVVGTVVAREGGPPETVTLTHPANWGPYKRELFGQIPHRAGLERVRMLTEPEAAAAHYASTERVPDGAAVAVYDLGGGTFDATVLRVSGDGFQILGTPEGIEGLGGIDFDEAVFAHVDRVLDGVVSASDPADVRATSAAIRLRQECVLAKEALSADTETTIPVLLPTVQTEVRLTRGELEDMIRPSVAATVDSMRRALRSAGVTPAELHTVLLVGGSSRIPAVARTVSAELGRPTSVDAHPKHAIALGAAAAAGRATAARAGVVPAVGPGPAGGPGEVLGDDAPTPPGGFRAVPAAAAGVAAVPVAATMAAAVPAGPESTLPTAVAAAGPGAPAAGTPAPALQAPASPDRRRRRVGVAVGAGVLVAATAVAGALIYGAASGASPETAATPEPAGVSSVPPTPAPTRAPVVAEEPVATSDPDTGGGEVVRTPERVPERRAPAETRRSEPSPETTSERSSETTSTEDTSTAEPGSESGGGGNT